VILGCCEWDKKSDVWSLGCIMIEMYTGDLFFETHETYEHLALIEKLCGKIPKWMVKNADKKLKEYFKYNESNGNI